MIGPRHPVLARLRRLSRQRTARTQERAYVVDGPTLLAELLDADIPVSDVVAEPDAPGDLLDRASSQGAVVHRAAAGALARVTTTTTPQPVAAITRFEEPPVDQALAGIEHPELVLVLVAVNDPGNAGTLLRSADAVGAGAVVFCDDAVDPYNPKCVRATAGSLFRLRVVRSAPAGVACAALAARGVRRVGTVARGGDPYDQVDLTGPTAVVVGSEAHGLPAGLGDQLDAMVRIPMRGPVESLNVAMAGTVVCFEALRQRRAVHAAAAGTPTPTPTTTSSPNPLDGARPSGAGCSAA